MPGVAEVVGLLAPAVEPLTIASFLTAPNRALGARPIEVLRAGGAGTAQVLAHARGLASSLQE